MSYLKDREVWLEKTPTGNPPAEYYWKFIQDGVVVVRDSDGVDRAPVNKSGDTMTGDLTIPDKIIHSGDSNTSIRFPANDTVSVETNGEERVRVTSSGDVGIGTTSPGTRLDIQKGTSGGIVTLGGLSTDQLTMGSDGTGHYQEWNSNTSAKSVIRLQSRNSGAGNYTSILVDGGNQNFRVITNSTERMRITSTGDVLPGANATQDLGSDTLRWNTVYTSDLSLKNDHGDWTVVEGEDDLFLYNNKKGKVYKFALTEVDPDIAPPKRDQVCQ